MSQSLHLPSNPTSPIPKPPRLLPRSPSDPIHLSQSSSNSLNGNSSNGQQPIYVLTADGSSLFLLDPTKPRGGEEPPPYASFSIPSNSNLNVEEGGVNRPVIPDIPNSNTDNPNGRHRDRARTLSALNTDGSLIRPRYHSTQSYSARRTRSALSSPNIRNSALQVNENTPLLDDQETNIERVKKQRGIWRSIWCGDLDEDENAGGWGKSFKRFWRPVGRGIYWRATLHLVLLNFPLALLVWPFLVAGTLAGTVLLITLPIGAAVWWLTLFISRSAARLESVMQLHYHSPLNPASPPSNHPIFYRLIPNTPISSSLSSPTSLYPQTPALEQTDDPTPSDLLENQEISIEGNTNSLIWEKRFMKCSYAMFLDHYSYSALSYFLLIKPLIVLLSTIVIIILFPIGFGTIIGLPIYLRILRKWGKWQAEVAIENL
ncbi:uncharacterized protein I206_107376 [Kwoniella pini CBS 10737]|uniref:Uncharacterized protein n=1 Tax=Kwoniella pini CBS 10737 TaxID=1296096 RepID=A0A1B9HX42_9TREE|nr:uncharacterized protein I206_05702 [Kwoniella pini CBS 10737]OCF47842.1 hypothetical protein I206_05702 [Kwoniella pini CBS 10737]